RPATKTAVASASLVLDTYVHNSLWKDIMESAELFLSLNGLGDTEFRNRLAKMPGDSYLKWMEDLFKKEEYSEVTSHADKFMKKYSNVPVPGQKLAPVASARTPDVLFLAGLAAQKSKE